MVLTIFDTYPYRVCLKIGSTLNFDRHQFLDNSWRERGEKPNLNRITKLKIVIKYLSILVCLNDSRSGSFIPILIHIVGDVPHLLVSWIHFFSFFWVAQTPPWPTRPLLKRVFVAFLRKFSSPTGHLLAGRWWRRLANGALEGQGQGRPGDTWG
jgi:hypothetical protein